MAIQIINIPRINDTPADFAKLFVIWSQALDSSGEVVFNLSECAFLRPNAVAFLGGLARLLQARGTSVDFDWNTCRNGAVKNNLEQNGFADKFGHPSKTRQGESIPYRENADMNMNEIMDYLTDSWLGRGWVHVSPKLRDAIVGRVWEIYNNAFEHSRTGVGVFSCGQHFGNCNDLILSVVDFGQGIPANVRNFFHSQQVEQDQVEKLSDAACLKWAFERGNSTCPQGVARGLGLDLLREFVHLNQGKLEIYSNGGYAIADARGERFINHSHPFEGTVVHITLRCDEMLYQFRDEAEPPF
ncbi:MAG: ATP-binding protein [Candidatus Hydrogenedentes bacterium]|nr:ATP-binding protein [Candidatus Hydrogenedentota bacterium]